MDLLIILLLIVTNVISLLIGMYLLVPARVSDRVDELLKEAHDSVLADYDKQVALLEKERDEIDSLLAQKRDEIQGACKDDILLTENIINTQIRDAKQQLIDLSHMHILNNLLTPEHTEALLAARILRDTWSDVGLYPGEEVKMAVEELDNSLLDLDALQDTLNTTCEAMVLAVEDQLFYSTGIDGKTAKSYGKGEGLLTEESVKRMLGENIT